MQTDRSKLCGCKGIRTCLKCEAIFNISPIHQRNVSLFEYAYVYCTTCDRCWRGWDYVEHDKHEGECIRVDGIQILENFLTLEEESQLINNLELLPWELSQSGRRKQNFGPKCNFKKRKLRLGNFKGFPKCTKFIHEKFKDIEMLKDFHTVELCTLEYDPCRGASIDPHIDDCWIWGERIITVNLMSDTVLTLTPYIADKGHYNYDLAPEKFKKVNNELFQVIRIPLPRRSLIVLTGEARYSWLHQIYREDICSRRLCLAFREFTTPYLPGGEYSREGKEILVTGKNYW
uniref:Fe2OG dioxygenase domain-containing protein n=2 Tax=Rhodnius TaxID=13248 RepID=T1I7G8_RHOPR